MKEKDFVANDMENISTELENTHTEYEYFIDNGREYISHEMVQKELGIKHMELERLLAIIGCNWMIMHDFNGKTYFERSYFEETILNFFNHLKEKNALHRIQWNLPDKR